MENILNLDLNDIVSKEVQEKINGLNERISSLSKENRELRAEERKAKDALLKVENFSKLFESSKAAGWIVDLCGNIERFGEVKDLTLVDPTGGRGLWQINSGTGN